MESLEGGESRDKSVSKEHLVSSENPSNINNNSKNIINRTKINDLKSENVKINNNNAVASKSYPVKRARKQTTRDDLSQNVPRKISRKPQLQQQQQAHSKREYIRNNSSYSKRSRVIAAVDKSSKILPSVALSEYDKAAQLHLSKDQLSVYGGEVKSYELRLTHAVVLIVFSVINI